MSIQDDFAGETRRTRVRRPPCVLMLECVRKLTHNRGIRRAALVVRVLDPGTHDGRMRRTYVGVQRTEEELLLVLATLCRVYIDLELIEVVSVVELVVLCTIGLYPGSGCLALAIRPLVALVVEAGLLVER